MALQASRPLGLSARPFAARPLARVAPRIACAAQKDGQEAARAGLPVAALVAAALLASSLAPEEALAARSGGRVGGSSFSARRSAPAPSRSAGRGYSSSAAPPLRAGGTTVVAPTVIVGGGYGYGFSPFGGFFSPMPFFMPMGSLFQFFILTAVLGVVFNAIKGAAANAAANRKDEDWDDL